MKSLSVQECGKEISALWGEDVLNNYLESSKLSLLGNIKPNFECHVYFIAWGKSTPMLLPMKLDTLINTEVMTEADILIRLGVPRVTKALEICLKW